MKIAPSTGGSRGWLLMKMALSFITLGLGACSSDNSAGSNYDGGNGFDLNAACVRSNRSAVNKPVNLYIVFDKTSSMAGSKWSLASAGFLSFASAQKSSGVNAALRFFPRSADSTPACDPLGYKQPLVGYSPIPAGASAFSAAFSAETPNGASSPIYPALGGALLKAIEVALSSPTDKSTVLLVTDGQPAGPAAMCGSVDPSNPQAVANLAAVALAANPPVSTYVVGLPGADQAFANLLASAGGTQAAFFTSTNDIQAEFQDALSKIYDDARPCAYEVPAEVKSGEVSPGLLNLALISGTGAFEFLPFDPTCRSAGWHLDDDGAPTAILPCAATCAALKAMPEKALHVVLGCSTFTS